MATKLTDLEISEVSLVDEPANDEARVVVVKAKGGFKPCDDCKDAAACKAKGSCASASKPGKKVPMAKVAGAVLAALNELSPQIVEKALADFSADPDAADAAAFVIKETVMDLQELQKALSDAEATIATLEKRATEAEEELKGKDEVIKAKDAEIDRLASEGTDPEAEVMKSLPESIRKRLEDADKVAKAASEEVAKMKAAAEEKEAVEKAKALKVGDAEKLGPLLLRVAKGRSTEADAAELETLLKSAGEVASKSPLFKSIGTPLAADADPEAMLVAKAKEIEAGSKGTLTYAQAYDRAMTENPGLYDAYIAKRRQPAA